MTLMKSGDNQQRGSKVLVHRKSHFSCPAQCVVSEEASCRRDVPVFALKLLVHTAAPDESLLHVRMALLFLVLPQEKVLPRAVLRHNQSW